MELESIKSVLKILSRDNWTAFTASRLVLSLLCLKLLAIPSDDLLFYVYLTKIVAICRINSVFLVGLIHFQLLS